jgi:hypothetical protein
MEIAKSRSEWVKLAARTGWADLCGMAKSLGLSRRGGRRAVVDRIGDALFPPVRGERDPVERIG